MSVHDIKSQQDLHDWLAIRPTDWAQVIAVRAALRVLQFIVLAEEQWLTRNALTPFRAVEISWGACSLPAYDMKLAAATASSRTATAAAHTYRSAASAVFAAAYSAYAVNAAPASGQFAHNTSAKEASRATHHSFESATHALGNGAFIWAAIASDCHWLENHDDPGDAAQQLTCERLWQTAFPKTWHRNCQKLWRALLIIDPNYFVWIDWHNRRIRGECAAFDIPGDKGRVEDKKILLRLAEATDEDFWGKGHEYVNATLKGWLEEARARVAPLPEVEAEPEIPPQDRSAISYGINAEGKIDRLPFTDQTRLREVPDLRRDYADLREAALELFEEGQRLGPRLLGKLARFCASLSEDFAKAEVSPLWRDGNALRRLNRKHVAVSKSPEPDPDKLDPTVAEGLGGVLDLFNNICFADDGLRARDERRISPQERETAEGEALAAIPLVDAILSTPEIATERAIGDIEADRDDTALPADDPYAAQVLDQANRTRRNFAAGLLDGVERALANPKLLGKRAAIGIATGAGSAVGLAVVKSAIGFEYGPLLQFVAANAAVLKSYVIVAFQSYPHLPELIDRVAMLWNRHRPR